MIDLHHLPRIQIRIGEMNPVLDAFLQANHAQSWMVLTAWNPNGCTNETVEVNQTRQAQLLTEIQTRDLIAIPMWGLGDKVNWAAEPSFLILNVQRDEVQDWLHRYQQNACVFGSFNVTRKNTVPMLIQRSEVALTSETSIYYQQTTYESAPLLLHHPNLCQTWLRACQAHRVSIGQKIELSNERDLSSSKIRLRFPLNGHLVLSFWSH